MPSLRKNSLERAYDLSDLRLRRDCDDISVEKTPLGTRCIVYICSCVWLRASPQEFIPDAVDTLCMDHPEFVEQTEPEAVFTLLSDDNRVDILRALWDSGRVLTFSELHDAVDIRDSGQFNYHLNKLVGQFVDRTEEGYKLTVAGQKINGAIEAGSYTTSGQMEPISFDSPCPTCGGNRTFTYEDEQARVDCDSCDVSANFPLPPSAFAGRDREEIPHVAGQYLRKLIDRLDAGFCSLCDGPVEKTVCTLDTATSQQLPSEYTEEVVGPPQDIPIVQYQCHQCGLEPVSGLTVTLLSHPAVTGFYYEHGIDIRDRSIWEFTTIGPEHEQVRSRDPFRASVTFSTGDTDRTLVVDERLNVVETE